MQSTAQDTGIDHYENFPVASLLCPPALRVPIAAIYHFARTADDLADEGTISPAQRLADLACYRAQLQLAADNRTAVSAAAASPTLSLSDVAPAFDPRWALQFQSLQRTLVLWNLPLSLLNDLLDAFTQDVEMTRDGATYADEAVLYRYCQRSANPIGRLLLHLYGVKDAQSLAHSDAICTALQLINFWQDASVDIPRGRYYFSDALCARHGVSLAMLQTLRSTPATRALLRECVEAARALMHSGIPLVHRLPGRTGWELRLVVQGGLRILDKITALNFATLEQRPVLGKADYALMAMRACTM